MNGGIVRNNGTPVNGKPSRQVKTLLKSAPAKEWHWLELLQWLLAAVTAAYLLVILISSPRDVLRHDSTDPVEGRSGLGLRIDSGTGCHYLVTLFGGITPRLDSTGAQICTGEEGEREMLAAKEEVPDGES